MKQQCTVPQHARGRSHWAITIWWVALITASGLAATASAQLNRTQHNDGWILAAAHAPGLNGAIWRTDLWVNTSAWNGTVTLFFCEAGVDNTDVAGHTIEFSSDRQRIYLENAVDEILGIGNGSWVGAIHYTATADVQVYARVYSTSPDGRETYGQVIEGIPTSDMSMGFDSPDYPGTQEDQWMFAMKHTADGRYRVNIGMVNPTSVTSRFYVSLFDETNNYPGPNNSIVVEVPPFSFVQLTDPFADINGGEWNEYIARVECETADGGAFGYASVVDNATNDAFFVRGVKRMRPE